jgi:crotonobetainyl-CoA:carnitine CoA-transferase CaiB-like acyl-CoA transferase
MHDAKPTYAAIPQLGENTEGVLKELLNYDDAQLEMLRQNKVI